MHSDGTPLTLEFWPAITPEQKTWRNAVGSFHAPRFDGAQARCLASIAVRRWVEVAATNAKDTWIGIQAAEEAAQKAASEAAEKAAAEAAAKKAKEDKAAAEAAALSSPTCVAAALRIQAWWRGLLVRMRSKQQRLNAERQRHQRAVEKWLAPRERLAKLLSAAWHARKGRRAYKAVRQARLRQRAVRYLGVLDRHGAAERIQGAWRRRQGRRASQAISTIGSNMQKKRDLEAAARKAERAKMARQNASPIQADGSEQERLTAMAAQAGQTAALEADSVAESADGSHAAAGELTQALGAGPTAVEELVKPSVVVEGGAEVHASEREPTKDEHTTDANVDSSGAAACVASTAAMPAAAMSAADTVSPDSVDFAEKGAAAEMMMPGRQDPPAEVDQLLSESAEQSQAPGLLAGQEECDDDHDGDDSSFIVPPRLPRHAAFESESGSVATPTSDLREDVSDINTDDDEDFFAWLEMKQRRPPQKPKPYQQLGVDEEDEDEEEEEEPELASPPAAAAAAAVSEAFTKGSGGVEPADVQRMLLRIYAVAEKASEELLQQCRLEAETRPEAAGAADIPQEVVRHFAHEQQNTKAAPALDEEEKKAAAMLRALFYGGAAGSDSGCPAADASCDATEHDAPAADPQPDAPSPLAEEQCGREAEVSSEQRQPQTTSETAALPEAPSALTGDPETSVVPAAATSVLPEEAPTAAPASSDREVEEPEAAVEADVEEDGQPAATNKSPSPAEANELRTQAEEVPQVAQSDAPPVAEAARDEETGLPLQPLQVDLDDGVADSAKQEPPPASPGDRGKESGKPSTSTSPVPLEAPAKPGSSAVSHAGSNEVAAKRGNSSTSRARSTDAAAQPSTSNSSVSRARSTDAATKRSSSSKSRARPIEKTPNQKASSASPERSTEPAKRRNSSVTRTSEPAAKQAQSSSPRASKPAVKGGKTPTPEVDASVTSGRREDPATAKTAQERYASSRSPPPKAAPQGSAKARAAPTSTVTEAVVAEQQASAPAVRLEAAAVAPSLEPEAAARISQGLERLQPSGAVAAVAQQAQPSGRLKPVPPNGPPGANGRRRPARRNDRSGFQHAAPEGALPVEPREISRGNNPSTVRSQQEAPRSERKSADSRLPARGDKPPPQLPSLLPAGLRSISYETVTPLDLRQLASEGIAPGGRRNNAPPGLQMQKKSNDLKLPQLNMPARYTMLRL
eukprot:TRINITY_DN38361_c0_g1_i1.p1 TRINITY_DN38361_c0_g1~~TRINITY_DN38361_c0_g1_i1.p1  ORF type:complete len:1203 (-),score=311.71 TRINITY_DN38361_c0_g1_i1:211-3819(-)